MAKTDVAQGIADECREFARRNDTDLIEQEANVEASHHHFFYDNLLLVRAIVGCVNGREVMAFQVMTHDGVRDAEKEGRISQRVCWRDEYVGQPVGSVTDG